MNEVTCPICGLTVTVFTKFALTGHLWTAHQIARCPCNFVLTKDHPDGTFFKHLEKLLAAGEDLKVHFEFHSLGRQHTAKRTNGQQIAGILIAQRR